MSIAESNLNVAAAKVATSFTQRRPYLFMPITGNYPKVPE